MTSAKEALASYDNGGITTLQELEEKDHIRLVVASSPLTGLLDVDKVGMVEWQIAFYAAGQTGICTVLGFIHHVLNHKVQQGQLREVPPLQVFACPGLHVMTVAPPAPQRATPAQAARGGGSSAPASIQATVSTKALVARRFASSLQARGASATQRPSRRVAPLAVSA